MNLTNQTDKPRPTFEQIPTLLMGMEQNLKTLVSASIDIRHQADELLRLCGQDFVRPSRDIGHERTEKKQAAQRAAYNIKEAAEMLGGISDKSVRRLIARGLLHQSKALRTILIPRTEIERFLRETM